MKSPLRREILLALAAVAFCLALVPRANAQFCSDCCSGCNEGCNEVGYVLGVPVACGFDVGSCRVCMMYRSDFFGYSTYYCVTTSCGRGDVQRVSLSLPSQHVACGRVERPFILKRVQTLTRGLRG